MSKGLFLDPLDLRAYAKREWVLLPDPYFRYQAIDGKVWQAPRWFVTDLASIPWLVAPLFDSVEHREAGVIHDWLYCSQIVPREVADALFFEMLLALGCDLNRARLMYAGVRIGGGRRYAQCRGGVKVEDLAFELMSEPEREFWTKQLAPAVAVALSNREVIACSTSPRATPSTCRTRSS